MSSSQYVAQLQPSGLDAFYFLSAVTPHGFIVDAPRLVQEQLSDPGVDGLRWRDVHLQYEPFTMTTVEDAANYTAGVARLEDYQNAVGKFGTLVYIAGGVSRRWRNVKIEGMTPAGGRGVLASAQVTGFGSSGGSAVLIVQWSLRLTQAGS